MTEPCPNIQLRECSIIYSSEVSKMIHQIEGLKMMLHCLYLRKGLDGDRKIAVVLLQHGSLYIYIKENDG
jgi:hypothetical protein